MTHSPLPWEDLHSDEIKTTDYPQKRSRKETAEKYDDGTKQDIGFEEIQQEQTYSWMNGHPFKSTMTTKENG